MLVLYLSVKTSESLTASPGTAALFANCFSTASVFFVFDFTALFG